MRRITEGPPVKTLRLLAPIVAACLSCGGGELEPADLALNEETCSHCRMAISDVHFAAQLVSAGGGVEFFDDIGCLVRWQRQAERARRSKAFVTDFKSGTWLEASRAIYVRSDKLSTPMAFGLAAFANEADARALAAELEGAVLSWVELQESE